MAITWDGAAWLVNTAYALADRVVNSGNVYLCSQAGTSAASGSGPTGTGDTEITDNTVRWLYQGEHTGSVVDVAPELATGATISKASQGVYLRLAEQLVANVAVWGDLLDDGRRYLAAHFGQFGRLRGRGPITAESVGPLSRSYGALTGDAALGLTAAGQQYMSLVRTTSAIFGFC